MLRRSSVNHPGPVGFQIRLVNNVNTVLIAKLVPTGLIRIVAGTHRVDIIPLHHKNVRNHIRFRNGTAALRGKFMTVHSLKHNPLSVQTHQPVLQFKGTKAYFGRSCFHHRPVLIRKFRKKGIEVRFFRTPRQYRLQPAVHNEHCSFILRLTSHYFRKHFRSHSIPQCNLCRYSVRHFPHKRKRCGKTATAVFVMIIRRKFHIPHMKLWYTV